MSRFPEWSWSISTLKQAGKLSEIRVFNIASISATVKGKRMLKFWRSLVYQSMLNLKARKFK
jgi:hypothetical protein